MLREWIGYFVVVTLWSALMAGVFNGLLYFGKGMLRASPTNREDYLKLITSSIIFGLTSAAMTLGIIAATAVISFPLFQHLLV